MPFEVEYLPIEILNCGVESSDLRDYLIPASALRCKLIESLYHRRDLSMDAADLPLRADTCILEFHGSHLTSISFRRPPRSIWFWFGVPVPGSLFQR